MEYAKMNPASVDIAAYQADMGACAEFLPAATRYLTEIQSVRSLDGLEIRAAVGPPFSYEDDVEDDDEHYWNEEEEDEIRYYLTVRVFSKDAPLDPVLSVTFVTKSEARLAVTLLSAFINGIGQQLKNIHSIILKTDIPSVRLPDEFWLSVLDANFKEVTCLVLAHYDIENFFAEMIALSKSAPLHIIAPTSKLPLERQLMEQAMSRIKELDILIDDNFVPVAGLTGIVTTRLQIAQLVYIPLATLDTLCIWSTEYALLYKGIPWKRMASLRVLKFTHIIPLDELPQLPELTDFHVNFMDGVLLLWLLRSLVNLPSIQCVDVSQLRSAHHEDDALSSFPMIPLSKLHRIKIIAQTASAFRLFDWIRISKSSVIDVAYLNPRADSDPSALTYLSGLKNFIKTRYSDPSLSTQTLRMSVFKQPLTHPLFSVSLGPMRAPLLSIAFSARNLTTSDYVELFSALPLSSIRELALITQVANLAYTPSILILNEPSNPALLGLGFESVRFGHDGGCDSENDNYQMLVDILRERQRVRLPVQVLTMALGTISPAPLEELKKFTRIIWAGTSEL
ncbi:hypothetical protein ONZ45_g10216 [Pleurotus djamor]|nr:hypothetical protein ONZ45_g10216 [Pleurotus djamor]